MGRDILSFSVIRMIAKGGWLGEGKIILSGTADERKCLVHIMYALVHTRKGAVTSFFA